jgi:uncharacterized membrane protein YqjE
MSLSLWIIAIAIAHLCLVSFSLFMLIRSGAYSRMQVFVQFCIAFFLPVIGAIFVITMAREAASPFPKSDDSKFDNNYIGSGD